MTSTSESVFGIYKNSELSVCGARTLKNSGFRESDISLLMMTDSRSEKPTSNKVSSMSSAVITYASIGAILGGMFGILSGAGFLMGTKPVPYELLNSLIVLFAGVGLGGSIGALTGFLMGLGNSQIKSGVKESWIENGEVLISVHGDNEEWLAKAKNLMFATGARSIYLSQNIKLESRLPIGNGIKFPINEVIIPQLPHIVTTH